MAAVHARVSPLILECALLDVDAVTPGEAFSVRVRARSEDGPVRVRAIDVSWHGVERLDPAWVKPEEPSEARAPKAGAGLNPGERCIAKSPAGAVAEGVVVRAGDVVERVVRVRLPPGLPPTFRGAVSRVSYFITCVAATADAREEAPDPPKAWERAHARVPLRVRAPDRDGFKNTREETTGRTDGTADGHDAGIFWMHELASAAGKTKTRAPRRASGDRRESDAKKKHDAYPAYSASPPSSPSSLLGVRTSPRSELGPNLGPTSPGSPLAAARGTAANGASSSVSVDEPTEKNRDPSRTVSDFDSDSVFLIAVADATAPSGRRKLAVVTPAPPFPRASASRDVSCRMDFFDGDDAETSETSETSSSGDEGDETDDEIRRARDARRVDEKRKTKKTLNEAFLRACRHARTPRVVRVVASLETREAVDAVGAGLRGAGYDPSAVAAAAVSPREEKHVLTRRRVWCETSQVVADVSAATFQLSAPREAPPSFESARVAVSWFLRVEFSVAAPRALLAARPRTKAAAFHLAAENARGVPRAAGSAHGEWTSALMPDDAHTPPPPPPSVSEWCVPLEMASPPPNRSAEFGVAAAEPRGSADPVSDATGLSRPEDAGSVRRMTRDSSLLALF